MTTNEFICVCLGLGMTGRMVDEICDNFKINIEDTEIYEVLSICSRDNYFHFGNILISDLYRKIIGEWVEQGLDVNKFDYEANGDDSHLYYDEERVFSDEDLQVILDELENEEKED